MASDPVPPNDDESVAPFKPKPMTDTPHVPPIADAALEALKALPVSAAQWDSWGARQIVNAFPALCARLAGQDAVIEGNGKARIELMRQLSAAETCLSASEAKAREVCLCAAVLVDGQIIRGHRHDDALQTAGKKGLDMKACVQGFLTSHGRFVDRREGMNVQNAAAIESVTGYRGDILFSEDLY